MFSTFETVFCNVLKNTGSPVPDSSRVLSNFKQIVWPHTAESHWFYEIVISVNNWEKRLSSFINLRTFTHGAVFE